MLKLELVDLLKIEIPLSVTNDIHGPIEYVFFTDVFEDLYGLKLVVHIRHYIQLNALNFFTIVTIICGVMTMQLSLKLCKYGKPNGH